MPDKREQRMNRELAGVAAVISSGDGVPGSILGFMTNIIFSDDTPGKAWLFESRTSDDGKLLIAGIVDSALKDILSGCFLEAISGDPLRIGEERYMTSSGRGFIVRAIPINGTWIMEFYLR